MLPFIVIGAPRKRQSYPTQGSGAATLIAKPQVVTRGPTLTASAISFPSQLFYFAATAEGGGTNSEYSNEVAFVRTNNVRLVTLAWDKSPSTNVVVTNYTIWKGRASGVYTNSYVAGTNLTLTVPLLPPALSNLVVAVTSVNATNLQWRAAVNTGSWTKLGATNYTTTNPPSPRFWRAMSKSKSTPSQVFIKSVWQ